eukprot:SAG31_NODE_3217_length_4537_cov_1.607481_1_plen_226_part_00
MACCKQCGQVLVWCTCVDDGKASGEVPEVSAADRSMISSSPRQHHAIVGPAEQDTDHSAEPTSEPSVSQSPARLSSRSRALVECSSCGQRFIWCACSPTTAHNSAVSAAGGLGSAPQAESDRTAAADAEEVGSGNGDTCVGRLRLDLDGSASRSEAGSGATRAGSTPRFSVFRTTEPESNDSLSRSATQATLYWGRRHQDADFGVRIFFFNTFCLLHVAEAALGR